MQDLIRRLQHQVTLLEEEPRGAATPSAAAVADGGAPRDLQGELACILAAAAADGIDITAAAAAAAAPVPLPRGPRGSSGGGSKPGSQDSSSVLLSMVAGAARRSTIQLGSRASIVRPPGGSLSAVPGGRLSSRDGGAAGDYSTADMVRSTLMGEGGAGGLPPLLSLAPLGAVGGGGAEEEEMGLMWPQGTDDHPPTGFSFTEQKLSRMLESGGGGGIDGGSGGGGGGGGEEEGGGGSGAALWREVLGRERQARHLLKVRKGGRREEGWRAHHLLKVGQ